MKPDEYFKQFSRSYWNYYLELEERIFGIKRYIEFDSVNYKTYSSNILILFQAVCSEIDVVGKEISSHFSEEFRTIMKDTNTIPINKWWFYLQDRIPSIFTEVQFFDSYILHPWRDFHTRKDVSETERNGTKVSSTRYNLCSGCKTPTWWTAYNRVKHQRLSSDGDGLHYKKANLENLSNAFAGLYLLEFYFMNTSFQDLGRLEESESQRLQAVERSERIFADFGSPG